MEPKSKAVLTSLIRPSVGGLHDKGTDSAARRFSNLGVQFDIQREFNVVSVDLVDLADRGGNDTGKTGSCPQDDRAGQC
jgi:hypothetical protein